jgi:hypothetical protein
MLFCGRKSTYKTRKEAGDQQTKKETKKSAERKKSEVRKPDALSTVGNACWIVVFTARIQNVQIEFMEL